MNYNISEKSENEGGLILTGDPNMRWLYRGMNYGRMPDDMLIAKFDGVIDNSVEIARELDEHARRTLTDRRPDHALMTFEEPSVNKTRNSGVLNQRINGFRGNIDPWAVYKPEQFYGFIGPEWRDPRGYSNQPNFNKLREQERARTCFIKLSPDANPNTIESSILPEESILKRAQTYERVRDARVTFHSQLGTLGKPGPIGCQPTSAIDKSIHGHDTIESVLDSESIQRGLHYADISLSNRARVTEHDQDLVCAKYSKIKGIKVGDRGENNNRANYASGQNGEKYFANSQKNMIYKMCAIMQEVAGRAKYDADQSGGIEFADVKNSRANIAAKKEINNLMGAIKTGGKFSESKKSISNCSVVPSKVAPNGLATNGRWQTGDGLGSDWYYINAEIMARGVMPGADMQKIRTMIILDPKTMDKDTRYSKKILKVSPRDDVATGTKLPFDFEGEFGFGFVGDDEDYRAHKYSSMRRFKKPTDIEKQIGLGDELTDNNVFSKFGRPNNLQNKGPQQQDFIIDTEFGELEMSDRSAMKIKKEAFRKNGNVDMFRPTDYIERDGAQGSMSELS